MKRFFHLGTHLKCAGSVTLILLILFSACPFFFGSRRPVRSASSEKSWTGSKLDSSNALSIEFTSRFVEYFILGRIGMTSG